MYLSPQQSPLDFRPKLNLFVVVAVAAVVDGRVGLAGREVVPVPLPPVVAPAVLLIAG